MNTVIVILVIIILVVGIYLLWPKKQSAMMYFKSSGQKSYYDNTDYSNQAFIPTSYFPKIGDCPQREFSCSALGTCKQAPKPSCTLQDINCTDDCQCPQGKVCCSANGVNQCGRFFVTDVRGQKYCW